MAIAAANLQIEIPKVVPKSPPEWREEFSELLLLSGPHHVGGKTKCMLLKFV